ncbi:glycosyltransferase family 4 protein [Myxococcota bacterium]|nr:glycosyltransferase family 4 protein [Myxococcota bacterium]
MRVLYLLRYYPTLTETFVYREVDALLARGIEVRIAALGNRADGELQAEPPAATVLRVPSWTLAGRLHARTEGQRWLAGVRGEREAARLPWLSRRLAGVDRLHVHFAGGAAEWARALSLDTGLPYTVMVHAVDLFRPRPAMTEVLRAADAVLTVAEHHQALLADLGVPARLVRCGPDPARWQAPADDGGPLRALAVGRNVPKKGLDLLLEAWRGLERPQARLDLVSDLPDPGLPGVQVHGLQPPPAVRQLVAGANLVVLPCRRAPDGDMDGVPVSLMEGMAAGRAVIGTAVSGLPELVDDEVGWLIPPEDPAALVRALRAAQDQPGERARRGRAGPARLAARGFTLQAQVEGLLASWGR